MPVHVSMVVMMMAVMMVMLGGRSLRRRLLCCAIDSRGSCSACRTIMCRTRCIGSHVRLLCIRRRNIRGGGTLRNLRVGRDSGGLGGARMPLSTLLTSHDLKLLIQVGLRSGNSSHLRLR